MPGPLLFPRLTLLPLCAALMFSGPARCVDNEDLAELVQPVQSIELGLGHIDATRPGHGEFFGLGRQNSLLFGQLDLRGGAAYDSDDARRWRLLATGFGPDSRSLNGEYGEQGRYRLRFSHDAQPFLLSDSYQTPLTGAGSAALGLPSGFTARNTNGPLATPGLAQAFSPFALRTQRQANELASEAFLNERWQIKAGYRQEIKQGNRAVAALSGSTSGTVLILPEPVNTRSEQFSLALAYAQARQHLQLSYRASFFRNELNGLQFQNPFNTGSLNNRLGSAPDNQLHQIKLDGGYSWGNTTRLNGALSYGRLSQNEAFLPYSSSPTSAALPQSSLNGLVVTESANLRLNSRPFARFSLTASLRHEARDNRTAVNDYTRNNYEAGSNGTVSNTPYSRSRNTGSLIADYALAGNGNLSLGLERENIRRYCHQLNTACTEVERSSEDTVRGEWRQSIGERLTGRLGYAFSDRRGDSYSLLTAGSELSGMRKFLFADRERSQLRSALTLLASDALAFNLQFDINRDHYRASRYGLSEARNRVLNLDASYAVNDDLSLYAFYTRQWIRSRLDSRYSGANQTALELPANAWQADMQDTVDAVGIGLRHDGLLSGRLTLSTDLLFLHANSRYLLSGGTCTSSSCNGNLPSGMPDTGSRQSALRSEAKLALDPLRSIRLQARFNHWRSQDYAYEGISATSAAKVLGTGELPFNSDGFFVGLSYVQQFRF